MKKKLNLNKMEKVFSTKFITLYCLEYLNKKNDLKKYYLSSRNSNLNFNNIGTENNAITVFIMNRSRNRALILKEFRMSVNRNVYNLCSGLIDFGETAISSLNREVFEETGYSSIKIIKTLKPSFSSVGLTDEKVQPFIITVDDSEIIKETEPGDNEEMECIWLSKKDAELILENEDIGGRCQLFLDNFVNGVYDYDS